MSQRGFRRRALVVALTLAVLGSALAGAVGTVGEAAAATGSLSVVDVSTTRGDHGVSKVAPGQPIEVTVEYSLAGESSYEVFLVDQDTFVAGNEILANTSVSDDDGQITFTIPYEELERARADEAPLDKRIELKAVEANGPTIFVGSPTRELGWTATNVYLDAPETVAPDASATARYFGWTNESDWRLFLFEDDPYNGFPSTLDTQITSEEPDVRSDTYFEGDISFRPATYADGGDGSVELYGQLDRPGASGLGHTSVVTTRIEETTLRIDASRTTAKIGAELSFTATGGESIETYDWSFGDGESERGEQVTHSYLDSGTYTVTLTAENDTGATVERTTAVTVERGFADAVPIEAGVDVDAENEPGVTTVFGIDADAGQAITVVGSSGFKFENELVLYTPDGERLDSFELIPDRTTIGGVAAREGTYHVAVRVDDGGAPSLTVYLDDPDSFEPNQDLSEAPRVEPDSRIQGTITETDREDWFALDAGPGVVNASLRLTRSVPNQNNVGVELYDADGDPIGEFDDTESQTDATLVGTRRAAQGARVSDAGTYYVQVSRVRSTLGSGPSAYELTVNTTASNATNVTASRTFESSTLSPGESTRVTLDVTLDRTDEFQVVETVDPALSVTLLDGPGNVVDNQLTYNFVSTVSDATDRATVTYRVTVPESATDGTTYAFDGVVDTGTETPIAGEDALTVDVPTDPVQGRLVDVRHSSTVYELDETVSPQVAVRNDADRAHTFYVGYSVSEDGVSGWRDNDGATISAVDLTPGETAWVPVEWAVERTAPVTTYDERVTLWRTANTTANGRILPSQQLDRVTRTDAFSLNVPPRADAGPDLDVSEGASVTLDGTASTDANDPLTFSWRLLEGGEYGTLTSTSGSQTTFDAAAVDAERTVIVELTVDDGDATATDTVALTVTSANAPPVAADVTRSTPESSSVSGTFDASDPDGDALSYAVVSGPDHGTVSTNGDAFTYSPATGYVGSDSFTYEARDGNGGSSTGTVVVDVVADPADNDRYEPNDGFATAAPVTDGSYTDLRIVDGERDYFAVDADLGDAINVSLSHAGDTLAVALYSPDRDQYPNTSDDEADSVSIADVPEPGTYYVRVTGPSGVSAPYNLDVSVVSAESSGSLSGTVVDDADAPIAGASVTVENQSGSVVATQTTNRSGRYRLDVAPGEYAVVAAVDGRTNRTSVTVESGRTTTATIVLPSADDDPGVTASRTFESSTLSPGESTRVTLDVTLDRTDEFQVVETADPALSVTLLDGPGNVVDNELTYNFVDGLGGTTDRATVSYRVTVPENATDGTTYAFDGTVVTAAETPIIGEDELTVDATSTPADYAGENGTIESAGLNDAVRTYLQGDLPDETLNEVIRHYLTGDSVA